MSKQLAFIEHSTIAALTQELFRFKKLKQLCTHVDRLREEFVLAPLKVNPNREEVVFWIRGFGLENGTSNDGYVGHFARVLPKELDSGKWTLTLEKVPVKVKWHPEHGIIERKHPNWGHPVLRGAKKGKTYASFEEAQRKLDALHEDFPESTIPGLGKMRVMAYKKPEPKQPPIEKLELHIVRQEDGTCLIESRPYSIERAPKKAQIITLEPREALAAQGKFTARLNRKRKRA